MYSISSGRKLSIFFLFGTLSCEIHRLQKPYNALKFFNDIPFKHCIHLSSLKSWVWKLMDDCARKYRENGFSKAVPICNFVAWLYQKKLWTFDEHKCLKVKPYKNKTRLVGSIECLLLCNSLLCYTCEHTTFLTLQAAHRSLYHETILFHSNTN